MIETNTQLTGLEKASVLLMSLGSDASEEVLKRLSPEERDLLGAQIVRMRSVKSIVREKVLDEVSEVMRSRNEAGSPTSPVPPGKIPGGMRGIEPFVWLEDLEPSRVAGMIAGERPHTIALILSHLSPSTASDVLACLDENTRDRAAQGLARITQVSDEVVRTVDEVMRKRAFGPSQTSERHGTAPILKSLAEATTRAKESMLAAISREHISGSMPAAPELSSMEGLIGFTDARVRAMLGDVDLDDLCLALRVASDELIDVVTRNVPASTAALIRDRLQATAQIRIREIEIAQQRVLGAVQRAIHDGDSVPAAVEAGVE